MIVNYEEMLNQYVRVITVFIVNDYQNKETFYGYLIDNDENSITLEMLKVNRKINKNRIANIILIDKLKYK
jgi:ribosome maturation factor RimP